MVKLTVKHCLHLIGPSALANKHHEPKLSGYSKNRITALLRLAAINVGKTETALGAFYRRLAARVGKAKAVTATARKLAVLFYNTLRYGMDYSDPGASYYEEQHRQRVVRNLARRAKQFGYTLEPAPTAGVS